MAEWAELASVGDVRRFLKWVVHSMRNQSLESNQASIFAQIGGVLLKATQMDGLEQRLSRMEQQLEHPETRTSHEHRESLTTH